MPSNHIVLVTFKPKPESFGNFETLIASVQADLPGAEGCNRVRVLRSVEQPPAFVLIEDWESKDLHAAHVAGLVETGAWAKIEAMLNEPPASVVLGEI
ncbi:antibiotic biosynthesis monooxygenase [Shimia litoralis]|uniref:Antibiotic biosynthesis monooxygenase n=1 Tax=Shimia litoralis TaxID=420403 RepID=A0A4U7MYX7_9RHOB|nr:antibiotic biosynthesis monooxygenase family protein [Shimia litoralis]TKZ17504.1 antibiotic biosynthesis monooxygenase [Shimia litoralis]